MARCPDCNKFVGLETQEPEENDVAAELTGEGEQFSATAELRLVRACADCGTELKETTFEIEVEGDIIHEEDCDPDDRDLDVELTNVESTETGGGRYAKNMIGVRGEIEVTCQCGACVSTSFKDAIAASGFDELV
jgi:hypothetical protein